ncbi:MAG TPA: tetratricopeptide repeat protein [Candidatus Wujingus californicus]|uniref:tetratricopeptide repeat protein n=1 Tax=Candidatus Wujingus californicus TaxID=3367618 RepID=UPI00271320D8|nr:tetratricopeptide repeat protein [Candidatus Brocadiales bacterium]
MKKLLPILISIFILSGFFNTRQLLADRDEDANKTYLDAYNMYKLGKLDQSLELLRKVIEINPDHAEAHFGMGSIYFRQNMFDDAVKEFTKVTKIKPEYVEAYQRLWLAYKKLGMNDKAEEELLKYKKLLEERMQAMGVGSTQVAKPVATPIPEKKEEYAEKPKPEEPKPQEVVRVETPQPVETKPQVAATPDTSVVESRPSEETRPEGPAVVKPVLPQQEESKPSTIETKPPRVLPSETPSSQAGSIVKEPSEAKTVTKQEPEPEAGAGAGDTSPYIKVDKSNPVYENLFKPLKKRGSGLFRNPFKIKKGAEIWKKSYVGKLSKGFIYYVVVVQIWLCIVASLCIYFSKSKRKKV